MSAPLSNELFFQAHRGLDLAWMGTGNTGYGKIDKSALGTHWTTDPEVAKRFSHKGEDASWRTKYAKIMHANVPMGSVETRKEILHKHGADWTLGDPFKEKEVLVKEGAPVQLTGITKLRKSGEQVKSRTRTYKQPREMKA